MIAEELIIKTEKKTGFAVWNTAAEGGFFVKNIPGIFEKGLVLLLMNMQTLFYCVRRLKKPVLIWKTLGKMIQLKHDLWGGNNQRVQKINGRYYFHMYAPHWPSAAYRSMIKRELLRQAFPHIHTANKTFIFLAITRKCPLRCEHCFEWDNLNQKETFTKEELMQIVDLYQEEGVLQIHLSGGEPMVRMHDLVEVIRHAKNKSDCFVLTSGFNLTEENALLLKQSGCTGVVVSIDHYIPELHNAFRHNPLIFQQAINGVQTSLKAGMVTAITVCATCEFIEGGHLYPYFEFARELGVHYVQLLEPRAVGHFAGKDVLLKERHLQLLETFFKEVNSSHAYKNYPTVLYHGYHQRRMGCYTGSHSVYIDSAGDVHACPFCHTKSYNIADILKVKNKQLPIQGTICPAFGNS